MSQDCSKKENFSEVLEIASMAGHIMLENGAEIARVEETMERISAHWGVTSRNFFVLSNGIFTTGDQGSESGGKDHFANVEFIPIKGTQMDKIVETNRLSRDIEAGRCDIATARVRLAQIRAMKPKPAWEQILGSAVGSSAFCAIFGGGFAECLACLLIGALLWMSVLWLTPGFTRQHHQRGAGRGALLSLLSGFPADEHGQYGRGRAYSPDSGSRLYQRHTRHRK